MNILRDLKTGSCFGVPAMPKNVKTIMMTSNFGDPVEITGSKS